MIDSEHMPIYVVSGGKCDDEDHYQWDLGWTATEAEAEMVLAQIRAAFAKYRERVSAWEKKQPKDEGWEEWWARAPIPGRMLRVWMGYETRKKAEVAHYDETTWWWQRVERLRP